ncbi:CheR family methyltransferase [Chlorogloea sp. CCALA 695]|uniref:CheR family methyltransferase n=1 Tax=Chlorogloea sp. CCALA 695 TaxID=2107693 RepID=UPI000D053F8A|nr:protein-glutamate O-methyltransferase CheR [Chlorogloea sp. CCALA 695]PSB34780.1 chemotaxis protein CheR [Chlorogloea sp. CCALA 695]
MAQEAIEALLRQKIGLDANSIGSRTIARAVEQRQIACGLPDRAAYLHHLQTVARELEELIETVVVPETWFFRDTEPFVYLNQYVRSEWLKANFSILRVLSVPCSTGEEPYSIAMTLLDSGLNPTQFCIDAVDVSKRALLKAKQGIYSQRAFRGGGDRAGAKGRYFEQVADSYQVKPFVRDTVKFIQGNLLNPGFLAGGKYQVIFCRNLLIYLDGAARNQGMQALDRALAPGGLFFVGAAETGQIPTNYTPIRHPIAFAYRKGDNVSWNGNGRVPNVLPKVTRAITTPDSPFQAPPTIRAVLSPPPPQQLEIAKQLADRGQLIEAAKLGELYLSANRTHAEAYVLLGEIYQGLDRIEQAEQSFSKAIYLNPHAINALIGLALLKEQRGDFLGAEILRQRVQRLLKIQNKGSNNGSSDVE